MSLKSVLVTGGAGYIGSHACKMLADAGFTPIAYDDLSTGCRESVRWGPLVIGDIGDSERLVEAFRMFGISAVMHFAASAYVGESILEPRKYFGNNLSKTISLLDCLLENDIREFVFSSTCATYGVPESLPIAENHQQNPVSPYGESKRAIERILPWYTSAYGLRWTALRYFNAAGADPCGEIGECHPEETHLIPLAIRATLEAAAPLTVFGDDHPTPDGTAIRDFVHVTDLAGAHVRALRYLREGGESRSFNLGTGFGHSVAEVISAVEAISGRAVKRSIGPRRSGDPAALTADPSLAQRYLGWKAEFSDLSQIVATAWPWAVRQEELANHNPNLTSAARAHAGK